MKELDGKVAAITGAGSGIGRSLAMALAAKGCHLAISDLNEIGLAETHKMVTAAHPTRRVTSHPLDVADADAVYGWADRIVLDHGRANLIINNAGVAIGATVEDMALDDAEWLMNINFWGVVYGTKAFLPHLLSSGDGHIVNISSVFGLMGFPTQSAYNASKFAVRGFTEALRIELDLADKGVSTTVVHPGGIKTNIARSARMAATDEIDMESARRDIERLFITSPDKAAKVIISGIERDARRVLIGPDAHLLSVLARTTPQLYQRLIGIGTRRLMA